MNRNRLIGLGMMILLVLTPIVAAQFTDVVSRPFSVGARNFNSFFQGGWRSYDEFILFGLLFLLLFVAFHISLGKAMGGANRQTATLAFIIAFGSALSIVAGTDFGIDQFAYVAIGLAFLVLTILIQALLIKAGMENHKVAAFILALLIALFLTFFLGKLLSEGTPGLPRFGSLGGEGVSTSGKFFDWNLDKLKGWIYSLKSKMTGEGKQTGPTPTPTPPVPTPTPTPPVPTPEPKPFWTKTKIFGGSGLLVLAIILFLVLRRRGPAPGEGGEPGEEGEAGELAEAEIGSQIKSKIDAINNLRKTIRSKALALLEIKGILEKNPSEGINLNDPENQIVFISDKDDKTYKLYDNLLLLREHLKTLNVHDRQLHTDLINTIAVENGILKEYERHIAALGNPDGKVMGLSTGPLGDDVKQPLKDRFTEIMKFCGNVAQLCGKVNTEHLEPEFEQIKSEFNELAPTAGNLDKRIKEKAAWLDKRKEIIGSFIKKFWWKKNQYSEAYRILRDIYALLIQQQRLLKDIGGVFAEATAKRPPKPSISNLDEIKNYMVPILESKNKLLGEINQWLVINPEDREARHNLERSLVESVRTLIPHEIIPDEEKNKMKTAFVSAGIQEPIANSFIAQVSATMAVLKGFLADFKINIDDQATIEQNKVLIENLKTPIENQIRAMEAIIKFRPRDAAARKKITEDPVKKFLDDYQSVLNDPSQVVKFIDNYKLETVSLAELDKYRNSNRADGWRLLQIDASGDLWIWKKGKMIYVVPKTIDDKGQPKVIDRAMVWKSALDKFFELKDFVPNKSYNRWVVEKPATVREVSKKERIYQFTKPPGKIILEELPSGEVGGKKPTAPGRKAAQTGGEGKVEKEPLTPEQVRKLMEQALENA